VFAAGLSVTQSTKPVRVDVQLGLFGFSSRSHIRSKTGVRPNASSVGIHGHCTCLEVLPLPQYSLSFPLVVEAEKVSRKQYRTDWYLPVSICLFVSPLSMSTRTGAYTQLRFLLGRRNSLIPSLPFYPRYRSWPSAIRHSVISNLFPTRLKATPLKRSSPKLRALSGDHPTESSYLYPRRPYEVWACSSSNPQNSKAHLLATLHIQCQISSPIIQITRVYVYFWLQLPFKSSQPIELPTPRLNFQWTFLLPPRKALLCFFFRAFLGPHLSPRMVVRTPSGLSSYGESIQLNSIHHSVTDWPPSSTVHHGWAACPFYRCLYLYQSRKMIGHFTRWHSAPVKCASGSLKAIGSLRSDPVRYGRRWPPFLTSTHPNATFIFVYIHSSLLNIYTNISNLKII